MTVYWKFGGQFGKTDEEGIKILHNLNYNIKTISYIHYKILIILKFLFSIVLLPIILPLYMLSITCRMIFIILSKPINSYIEYFSK